MPILILNSWLQFQSARTMFPRYTNGSTVSSRVLPEMITTGLSTLPATMTFAFLTLISLTFCSLHFMYSTSFVVHFAWRTWDSNGDIGSPCRLKTTELFIYFILRRDWAKCCIWATSSRHRYFHYSVHVTSTTATSSRQNRTYRLTPIVIALLNINMFIF